MHEISEQAEDATAYYGAQMVFQYSRLSGPSAEQNLFEDKWQQRDLHGRYGCYISGTRQYLRILYHQNQRTFHKEILVQIV